MNPLDRLTGYLRSVERRLRVLTFTRGAAAAGVAALAATVVAVLAANHFAFSPPSVTAARVALFLALGFAVALGLIVPLARLNRRHAAREAEQRFPEFEERLLTFTERLQHDPRDPFLPLLASDSLDVAQRAEPDRVAAKSWILGFSTASLGSLAVLVWLGTSGPGFLGYGTALLWGGVPRGGMHPYYDVLVQPGSKAIRKRSDQVVTASLVGFRTERVRVLARYAGSSRWEQADMRPQADGPNFEFLFAGIPESMDYYVEAGGVRSKTYRFRVMELPTVKRLRVTYHYPGWTGMKDAVEDPGGDLRAVEGTTADVSVETDRPLQNGAILLDDGSKLALREEGPRRVAAVPISKDGVYHIGAVEQGEDVRLSEDYFIEAQKDTPPTVRIARPGRDARVSPIEEVTVAVEGKDDFGLQELALHYSVNAGPERVVPMLPGKGTKSAEGKAVIPLEDFKLTPGDLVSIYATARDARTTVRSDMFFIEAQPFERDYRQSQQMDGGGSGGGMGDQDQQMSQREKEIIAATWNQIKDKTGEKATAAENASFLAGVQAKLRDQSRSLVQRMKSRQLAGANQSFQAFVTNMEQAIEAMSPAADKLKGQQWQPALEPEQKALQHLLRAEATFRDIQVAFGSRGGSGGGRGMGRDLEGLFDLELDTEKNQYETGQQSASSDQRQRDVEEAMHKLEELARRQQELAEERLRNQQQLSQQRWQQEMLRREAEQLQKQLEELSRNQSASGALSRQGQQSGRQSGQQSGEGGQQELNRALERLQQATRDMRQAASSQQAGSPQSGAEARRAAERLQDARNMLSGMRQQQNGQEMDGIAKQADDLAARQHAYGNRLRQSAGKPGGAGAEQSRQLMDEKQKLLQDEQKLEQDMQRAVRALAGTQREASAKLREALGNLQQEEIGTRMRMSADLIRRGLAPYAAMREALTTQALDKLADDVKEAQRALKNGPQPQGGDKGLEQALAQVESLRRQLEAARKTGDRGRGAQDGRKPGDQARGEQSGRGSGDRAQNGAERGQQQAGPGGGGGPAIGDWGEGGDLRQALTRLQRWTEGNPDLHRQATDLLRAWEGIGVRQFQGRPELLDRVQEQVLGRVQDIELELRRLVDEKQGGNVRSTAGQPVPPGYDDAVAEYFRRLSKAP